MSQGLNLKKIHKKNKSTSDLLSTVDRAINTFLPFIPFGSDINDIANNKGYNERICNSQKRLIQAGEAEIRRLNELIVKKNFSPSNEICQELSSNLYRAKNFMSEISQDKSFQKYAKAISTKETLDELIQGYNNCINLLNFSLNVDALSESKLIRRDLDVLSKQYSEEMFSKLISIGQERQELKKENLQEKSKSSLEQITELSKQSKQIEESLTKKEQEITNLEILIEYKQNNIKTNENEIKNSPFNNEEERIKLEKQIADLKNQFVSLRNQLIEKGKELANLKQENNKLIEQCLFYLTLIKSFREKQKEIEEKKKELIENKKNLSEKELDNFCQLKEEYRSLETDLEEIIIVEQLLGERPKKRYWKSEELLVDQIIIDKWDNVLAEIRGYELPKEKSNFNFFEEIMRKIIKSCDKNTVKSTLLINRTNKDKSGLANTYNEVTPKGKEIIEKMIIFLNAKQVFLNTRQGTIERLRECYEKFKISVDTGKYALFTQVSNLVSSIGEIIPDLGGSITKGVGGVSSGTVNLFKNNAWKNCRNNFKMFLANDEKKIFWLKENYQSLITIIWDNEEQPISSVIIEILKLEKHKKESPFNEKYNIYRIVANILFQGESTLELEEMKKTIILLNSNFEEIKSELEEEKSKVYEQLKTYIQIPKIQISDYNNSIEPISPSLSLSN